MPQLVQASQASQASAQETPLPPELLAAPAAPPDAGWLFIDRMEEWRRAMGWEHKDFAPRLGISERHWRALREHQKELTASVADRVLQERPELEFILGNAARYFWERSKRRKRRTPRGLAAELVRVLFPLVLAAAAVTDLV